MAMGTVQGVNILTTTPEKAKYNETGVITEIWVWTVTTALAQTDTLTGPVIPAGTYLLDVTVGSNVDLDSGGTTGAYEVGYTGTLGAFIASGTTAGFSDGAIGRMNVCSGLGYTSTTDTTVLMTITTTAATPVAGTVRMAVSYTANP